MDNPSSMFMPKSSPAYPRPSLPSNKDNAKPFSLKNKGTKKGYSHSFL